MSNKGSVFAGYDFPPARKRRKVKATYDCDSDSWEMQEVRRYEEDTGHQRGLVRWVKWIVPLWLLAVVALLAGSKCLALSSGVLIALLTTTTANILGLAFIVLHGFFSRKTI